MSDTNHHPYRGLVMNLSWARVLASAAPRIALNECEEAFNQPNDDERRSSDTSAAQGQEQQSLAVSYQQQVRKMVNRLRSQELKDKQTMNDTKNAMSEECSIAAEAAAMHQPGWTAESTADSKPLQSVSGGLQPAGDSNSTGSLEANMALDRQLSKSRGIRAAASELLGHSIRYCMLQ